MALKQERNYGIDLLRMVAMFMVTVLHVLGQGGILSRVHAYSGQYLVSWFLEFAAYGSVNLYALISGYVGIKSKYKISNIVVLWLQVFLYSFGIALLVAIFKPSVCSFRGVIEYAFPVFTKKYWYFSAYVCLFLFMPLLNAGINALSKKSLQRVVIAMLIIFSVGTSAAKEASPLSLPSPYDPFVLGSGYTGLWLMVMYAVGAYIGKYGLWEKVPKPALLGIYIGCPAQALAIRVVVRLITTAVSGKAYSVRFVSSFVSPLVVLGSIALLLFFSRLKCGRLAKDFIAVLAPASFGVYIIHTHPLIWDHLIKNRFAFLANLHPLLLAGGILLSALSIYLVCSHFDLIRIEFFALIRIRKGLQALEKKLFGEKKKETEKIGGRE